MLNNLLHLKVQLKYVVMGIQPAHLEKEKNRALKKEERDILRAEYVQKHLPDILK